jgi:enamine deaminase RidA (YjgF/YER057c/UK114 family)
MEKRVNVFPPGKEDLYRQIGFCEAVRTGHTIYTAGQVGWESYETQRFEPDLESQTRQAFRNLAEVLGNAGATPQDVVQLTFFMVADSKEKRSLWDDLAIVFKVKSELFPGMIPCGTGVRVVELVKPGLLIEVQAVACVAG